MGAISISGCADAVVTTVGITRNLRRRLKFPSVACVVVPIEQPHSRVRYHVQRGAEGGRRIAVDLDDGDTPKGQPLRGVLELGREGLAWLTKPGNNKA